MEFVVYQNKGETSATALKVSYNSKKDMVKPIKDKRATDKFIENKESTIM